MADRFITKPNLFEMDRNFDYTLFGYSKSKIINCKMTNHCKKTETSPYRLNSQLTLVRKTNILQNVKYISAFRMLDASGLTNDFYRNLLDWNSKGKIAVGLENIVYIFDAVTNKNEKFDQNSLISSVSFSKLDHNLLAIGLDNGQTSVLDIETKQIIITYSSRTEGVFAIDWKPTTHDVFAVGSFDKIEQIDKRTKSLISHVDESLTRVCSIKYSPNGITIAAGTNNNTVIIVKSNDMKRYTLAHQHIAAVKAIAWHSDNLIFSGGGLQDQTVKLWDVDNLTCKKTIDVFHPVTGIIRYKNSIVISNGHQSSDILDEFGSLYVRNTENLEKSKLICRGHKDRVLSIVKEPDGSIIASLGADETLRLWKMEDLVKVKKVKEKHVVTIR